jgi:hypothetical protein
MEQQPDTKIFPLCKVHFGELLGHQQSFWVKLDTTAFQIDHGISFDTLVNEKPENILLIVHFNAFIRHILGCDHWTSNPSLEFILNDYEQKRKSPSNTKNNQNLTTKITNDADWSYLMNIFYIVANADTLTLKTNSSRQ